MLTEAPLILRGVTVKSCVSMGAYTYILQNVMIKNVTAIGRYCNIAANVVLWNINHWTESISTNVLFSKYNVSWLQSFYEDIDISQYKGWYKEMQEKHRNNSLKRKRTLIVGNDVWIGNGAKVLQGVTIGDGAVVGAGAIVTKDVPPYAIVAGNPAKIIRYRFSQEAIDRLLQLQWWQYKPEILMGLDIVDPDSKSLDALEKRIMSGEYSKIETKWFQLGG